MTTDPESTADGPPTEAALEHVRALLAGLGEERAPDAVVERLERVLATQLPPRGAIPARRRRPRLRIGLAVAAPVAIAVAIGIAVGPGGGGTPARSTGTPGGASVAMAESSAADSAAPVNPGAAPSGGSGGGAPSALAPTLTETDAAKAVTTPRELEDAARAAYDAVDAAIRARRK
jgi:hypothetical protein